MPPLFLCMKKRTTRILRVDLKVFLKRACCSGVPCVPAERQCLVVVQSAGVIAEA